MKNLLFILSIMLFIQTSQAASHSPITVDIILNDSAAGQVTGAGVYQQGTAVTVNATPNTGYIFVGWFIDGFIISMSPTFTLMATANTTISAYFNPIPVSYEVTANVSPANAGTITGAGFYQLGDTVTLTAHAAANYQFSNWQSFGIIVSTNTSYTFIVTGNTTLDALFTSQTTVNISTTAYPNNAAGSATGAGSYTSGSTVLLEAHANAGYKFANWILNGIIASSDSSYSFTATTDIHLHVNFIQITTSSKELYSEEDRIIVYATSNRSIKIETDDEYELTIFDISGRTISNHSINCIKMEINIPQPGVYMLHFYSDRGTKITKKTCIK